MTNKRVKCAFYGSLRRPMYNYTRLVNRHSIMDFKYLLTTTIPGWDMYDINSVYPGIKAAKPDRRITVDIFDISAEAYQDIYDMESGANFYEDEIIVKSGERPIIIFPYAGEVIEESRILCGDFVLYEKNVLKKTQNNAY